MKNILNVIQEVKNGADVNNLIKRYDNINNIIIGLALNQECAERFFNNNLNDLINLGFDNYSIFQSFVYYEIFNKLK